METLSGFILSTIKYGDYDAIVHSYTLEKGYQSLYVKGVYTAKNKKKAYLQALNLISFECLPVKNHGSLQTVARMEPAQIPDFHTDIKAVTVVFFIADFLNIVLRQENNNRDIYTEIQSFIKELSLKNYRSHLIFMIRILVLQGLSPLKNGGLYIDIEDGQFSDQQFHTHFNEEVSNIWLEALGHSAPYDLEIPNNIRRPLLDSIMHYYQHHYPGFRRPASLEVIQQVL